ncbi:helix-turn-helix domain-containing protein [Shewanella sp. 4t3-1-2LB]|uniref:helix-turn-helix domain-containing protein n=1 Tax=Shewanella sp. 4t3-1-2LB TaxID=2817682 RepID=UPI001A98848B|nr:helix-turn-helix domain-containing protein [Shewanella sp. 4t3-1-2LB]MBO1271169.1 helix-turn-helix domain-containing protein [Shewanella sp. 4t3-1-2LB]
MDIADASKKSGLPPSTLRYYEKLGLIHSIGRNGLRRQYSSHVIDKLNIISLGRIAGISLNEISEMFSRTEETGHYIDRELMIKKAQDIDEQIKCLIAVRNSLNHVATCPHSSHLECQSFRRLMKLVKRYLHK